MNIYTDRLQNYRFSEVIELLFLIYYSYLVK